MSGNYDLERRIADYYAAGAPPRAPGWVLERVRASVDATPQRRTVIGWPWRMPPMTSFAKVALTAVAIAAVGLVGFTMLQGPEVGPAASPSPTASPSPAASPSPSASPGQRSEEQQIIAEGTLVSFAGTGTGSVLTVWETCKSERDTDCGHAWRLGAGSHLLATGMVGRGDVHVAANAAAGGGFVLTPTKRHDLAFHITRDGTASPLASDCRVIGWSTPTEPGRLAWAGLIVDTVAGTYCNTGTLGGRSVAQGAFTADGTLWALLDNETDPDTLTIGRYDGVQWADRDLAAKGGSSASVLVAAGPNVVVLQAGAEPEHQHIVGLAVTTDDGGTWSELVDPDVLVRDLPFSRVYPDGEAMLSYFMSMAFAGESVLYVADASGSLWRSTDFATFTKVSVPGGVRNLTSAGDAVIARIDNTATCGYPAQCRLNDLVRISADGAVEPITAR